MPELPEVETVARALDPLLKGRRIEMVQNFAPRTFQGSPQKPTCINGLQIKGVGRRAKYIMLDLEKGFQISVHLRMTGWLGVKTVATFEEEKDPYVRAAFFLKPKQQTSTKSKREVLLFRDVRRFGRIWCGTQDEIESLKPIKKLGPDVNRIDEETFLNLLNDRRGRMKSLLLNQAFVAGLGNIYADEALFDASIHPEKETGKVPKKKLKKLYVAIQEVLNNAIQAGGTSLNDYYHPDGQPGWFKRALKVYGRTGEPCVHCKTKIKRIVVGQRGSWYCPQCQRA